jgi:hypothetical protein
MPPKPKFPNTMQMQSRTRSPPNPVSPKAALKTNADFKLPETSIGSVTEDVTMVRNIENMTVDSHLSQKLGIKLFRFKSIVAEAMGELDTAVIFQNDVIMHPRIQNQTAVNCVAKSQALLRLGYLNLRLENRSAVMNAAESAASVALSALERRKVDGFDEKLDAVMCDTITQLGDLLQVAPTIKRSLL